MGRSLARSSVPSYHVAYLYKLYASQYPIPGPLFRVPSSFLVPSTARLVMGQELPEGVAPFAVGATVLSMLVTIIKMRYETRWWQKLIPSRVSFAIGMIFSDLDGA